MSGRKIGTLIVVVLKGRNLPNKRHIGKQDPYCVCKLSGETRRTKAVKRGGQHPEWDDELRFPIYETADEESARTGGDGDAPPPPPPKDDAAPKQIKRTMNLICYADDPREPDLIGEATVDLTESLTKGETDEWFALSSKGKYSGEIYLEMTYWSEEAPPPKKTTPQPSTLHPQYGGPGDFTPASESIPASLRTGAGPPKGRRSSVSPRRDEPLPIPESLRPSSSLAKLDLYKPPYKDPRGARQPKYGRDSLGSRESSYDEYHDGFAELGSGQPRRRESFPTPGQAHRQTSYGTSASSYLSPIGSGFSPANSLPNSFSMMSIGSNAHHPSALSHTPPDPSAYGGPPPQAYGNGYGLPPAGFAPPQSSQTPAPSAFNGGPPPQFPVAFPSAFTPPASQPSYIPPSSSMGFHPPPSQFAQPPPSFPAASPSQYSPSSQVPYPPATQTPYPPSSATPAPYQPYQQQPYQGQPYAQPGPPAFNQPPPQSQPSYLPQSNQAPPPPGPAFYNNNQAPYYPSTTPLSAPPPSASAPPQGNYYPPSNQIPNPPPAPPASAPPQPHNQYAPYNNNHASSFPPPPAPGQYRGPSPAPPTLLPPGPPAQHQFSHSPPSMGDTRPLPGAYPGGPPPLNLPGPPPPLPFQPPPPPPPLSHSYQR